MNVIKEFPILNVPRQDLFLPHGAVFLSAGFILGEHHRSDGQRLCVYCAVNEEQVSYESRVVSVVGVGQQIPNGMLIGRVQDPTTLMTWHVFDCGYPNAHGR